MGQRAHARRRHPGLVAVDRAKQYAGNVNATVGGITLNIDKDIVGGPLAR